MNGLEVGGLIKVEAEVELGSADGERVFKNCIVDRHILGNFVLCVKGTSESPFDIRVDVNRVVDEFWLDR